VQREEIGWLLHASKEFNVPQATLRRRARNKNKYVNATTKGLGRFRPSLGDKMEADLVEHVLHMESLRLFGMSLLNFESWRLN